MSDFNFEDPFSIVIDSGSGSIKCGISGDDQPRSVLPTIIGKPKSEKIKMGPARKECYVGEQAKEKMGVLNLSLPIQHGQIVDWDSMEKVWHHTYYNELAIDPRDQNVLLTEAPTNTIQHREKMASLMFEKFQVPGLYIGNTAVLALYSSGRTTGIVLESGDGVTHTAPIYEGYALPHAVMRVNMAGRDMTEYLYKLLTDAGVGFTTPAYMDIVRQMKERLCYVALDFEEEVTNAAKQPVDKSYSLPDGTVVKVGTPRFRCPEALFKSSLLNTGKEDDGFHELVFKAINKCDMEVRRDLYSSIVLAGGTNMYRGLAERLEKEVGNLAPSAVKPKVIAPPERKYSVWIGGSILASLPEFQKLYVTEQEYEEHGARILHGKCF